MGFVSRIGRAWAGLVAKGSVTSNLPMLRGLRSAAGIRINQFDAMANSVTYASVTIRSKDVARCAPRLLHEDGPRSEKPIKDHPVARLFRRPNRWQTWFEFATQMHAAFLLRGNAYAVILRDQRGKPTELVPINPDAVLVYVSVDGSIFYQVSSYGIFLTAILHGLPQLIPADDVFHLRGLSFDILSGMSTISVARESIGVAIGLEQQAARFIANGARPSGVLKIAKTLGEDAAARLRTQWEAWRAGIDNVGRTAILEDGLEYQQLQLTSVDLEFMAQRKFSIEDVARFWGMPLHKLAVAGEVGKLKIDQADQEYVNTTIMPDLDIWEQKFAQKFDLDEEGITVDFDERRLLRAEEATRINNQRLQVMSGLKTQNECRAIEGDPPMEGGDVLLRPVNLAASGSDMSGTAPDGAGRPAGGNLPDPGAANETPKTPLLVETRNNPNHAPAGSSEGGQFTSGDGGGDAGSGAGADGGGAKTSLQALKDFVAGKSAKEVIAAVVDKAKDAVTDPENIKETIARLSVAVMYHGLNMDMGPDLEEAVRHEVGHLSTNAGIAGLMARDMMRSALTGLRGLRTGKKDASDDDVVASIDKILKVLDNDALFSEDSESRSKTER